MTQRHWFREYFEAILIAGVFLAFTNSYLVKTFYIPSGSMESTLLVGDHLFVNRFIYGQSSSLEKALLPQREIQRGDIVIFRAPADPTSDLVKRCIGLPGDKIEMIDSRLYVNGKKVENEPYASYRTDLLGYVPNQRPRDFFGPFTVPEDEFFFLGDNRNNSLDSRFWGSAPRRYIKGRASMIYWSYGGETSDGTWTDVGNEAQRTARTVGGFFTKTRWSRTFHLPR